MTIASTKMRSSPQQQRAKITVERIVSAAESLLAEEGWPGFTTNALAKRVGCPVATIYRYFPDKHRLVRIVAESAIAEWNSELADFEQAFRSSDDFFYTWSTYSEIFLGLLRKSPRTMAARRAMLAVPELRALDREDTRQIALKLSELVKLRIDVTAERSLAIASTLIESILDLVDRTADSHINDNEARALFSELRLMHHSYLSALGLGAK